jgi:hypothetical protein
LSSTENIEKLLQLIVEEYLIEFVVVHVLVPLWKNAILLFSEILGLVWQLFRFEKEVRLGVLHFEWKSVFFPVSLNQYL